MLTQTHSCCVDPFKEFITAWAMGKKSGWSHGCDPPTHCRLGRALTLRFVTLEVRSLCRLTEWCSARQFLLVKVACAYWLHECQVRRLFYDEWDSNPRWKLFSLRLVRCTLLVFRFGHRCLRQARVSDDTCEERRPRHVCSSIEVPFCIVLVRWSGQVKCGSASPFGVVSCPKAFCSSFVSHWWGRATVLVPCPFRKKRSWALSERSPVTVSSPKVPRYKKNGCISWRPWIRTRRVCTMWCFMPLSRGHWLK